MHVQFYLLQACVCVRERGCYFLLGYVRVCGVCVQSVFIRVERRNRIRNVVVVGKETTLGREKETSKDFVLCKYTSHSESPSLSISFRALTTYVCTSRMYTYSYSAEYPP